MRQAGPERKQARQWPHRLQERERTGVKRLMTGKPLKTLLPLSVPLPNLTFLQLMQDAVWHSRYMGQRPCRMGWPRMGWPLELP